MLPLVGVGAEILSNRALISGGIGTRWMRLTAGQSAAPMNLYSSEVGARQHPGQPLLLNPAFVGLSLAH